MKNQNTFKATSSGAVKVYQEWKWKSALDDKEGDWE